MEEQELEKVIKEIGDKIAPEQPEFWNKLERRIKLEEKYPSGTKQNLHNFKLEVNRYKIALIVFGLIIIFLFSFTDPGITFANSINRLLPGQRRVDTLPELKGKFVELVDVDYQKAFSGSLDKSENWLSVEEAKAVLGEDLILPMKMPKGFDFIGAEVNPESGEVKILYLLDKCDKDGLRPGFIYQYKKGLHDTLDTSDYSMMVTNENETSEIEPLNEFVLTSVLESGTKTLSMEERSWYIKQDVFCNQTQPSYTILDFHLWERGYVYDLYYIGSEGVIRERDLLQILNGINR